MRRGSRLSIIDDGQEPLGVASLLGELLREQKSLSAVDVFAREHASGQIPEKTQVYEASVEAYSSLGPNQQLAFRVNLDECTGCKACVTACHSLNGLAEEETWRDVGLLQGLGTGLGAQQTVTTACHHCEEPACLAGCPVLAYDKDKITGIVRHLDDQCIGCKYCVLKCPYDVPKYSHDLGIVRKCDMCTGRLSAGEAPACVQGCPNEAISITVVDTHSTNQVKELLPAEPGTFPPSDYTRPTTTYVSTRNLGSLQPADGARPQPAEAHDPLAAMLVLTQVSVGILFFHCLSQGLGMFAQAPLPSLWLSLGAAGVFAALGLGAATAHLGRPLYAFRAFLGWRTSWLSREIILFGAYVPFLVGATGLSWLFPSSAMTGFASLFVLFIGALAMYASMMIYVDTRRGVWAMSRTGPLFVGTAIGVGGVGFGLTLLAVPDSSLFAAFLGLIGGAGGLSMKLYSEWRFYSERRGFWGVSSPVQDGGWARSVQLLRGPLAIRWRFRWVCGVLGVVTSLLAVVMLWLSVHMALLMAGLSLVVLLGGELVERHLYFVSEASFSMPGQ